MGSLSSKRKKRVKSSQTHFTSSSPAHVVAAQNQLEAAGGEIGQPADNYLPRLTDTWLLLVIDFRHGLLDELIRLGVINREKIVNYRDIGLNSHSEVRAQLMNDVSNASAAQKEQFLSALDKTQQSHVTNYIRHNGQRPADTDDNWPAFEERRVIQEHLNRLTDLIDIECGLLDEIISAGILNEQQRDDVSACTPDRSKVRQLLTMMRQKSVADYKKFVNCLVETKQFRVVSILDPLTAADNPPLSEVNRAKLDANYSALVELIDLRDSGLLRELEAVDCLTYKQRTFIESTDNAMVSIRRLLDILRRGSQLDYDKFLICLGRTKQTHVANVLLTNKAVAVSSLTAHGKAVDKYQRYVVAAFMELLQESTTDSGQQLLRQVSSALGSDNELIFMKTTQSITLFIASRSLSGLIHLYDMYLNTQLKSSIQQILCELLQNKQNVIIDELVWDRLDYNRCVQHLAEVTGYSVYSKIYQYSSDVVTKSPIRSSLFDSSSFPLELKEIMVIKAAGQLFVMMKTITTSAATYTLATLSAVCRYWWQTLTCRRSNTQRLRQFFLQLCHPFIFNPRLVNSLQTEGEDVSAVDTFDGKLYVAINVSNTIEVYDLADSSSYDLIERIKVPGLIHASDLVVCSSTRCLFVSDLGARCILQINLSSDSNTVDQTFWSPFILTLQYIPYRLSVQSERLLIIPYDGNALYVYNINDVKRKSQPIIMPDYMDAEHAVETSRRTYVVAHMSKRVDDLQSDHRGVSELSSNGLVLRVFKGPTPFGHPFYITTVKGHFLVSDRHNRRVSHLNTDLELVQLLLADDRGNPLWQCYEVKTGLLFVARENSDTVTVYNVCEEQCVTRSDSAITV